MAGKYSKPTPLTSLLVCSTLGELVEYMEIAFVLDLTDDTALFQKIVRDLGTNGFTIRVEHDLQVLSLDNIT